MLVFIVCLFCCMVFFFMGVWIGTQRTQRKIWYVCEPYLCELLNIVSDSVDKELEVIQEKICIGILDPWGKSE